MRAAIAGFVVGSLFVLAFTRSSQALLKGHLWDWDWTNLTSGTSQKDASAEGRGQLLAESRGEVTEGSFSANGGPAGAQDVYLATVVTAYFKVPNAKHSEAEYDIWMRNFIARVDCPMVIFTTPESAPKMEAMRSAYANRTKVVTESDIWSLPVVKNISKAFRSSQRELDPWRHVHPPELYAIWTAKPYFTLLAARRNPFGSKYFLWVDIGSFRDGGHKLHHWPDANRLQRTFEGREDMILLGLIRGPENESEARWWLKADSETGPIPISPFVEGTFFGGTVAAIQWFAREFYSFRDKWIGRGAFVGDDQHIMTTVALLNWRHVMLLDLPSVAKGGCPLNLWFYFQHWLAREEEGDARPSCQRIEVILLSDADAVPDSVSMQGLHATGDGSSHEFMGYSIHG